MLIKHFFIEIVYLKKKFKAWSCALKFFETHDVEAEKLESRTTKKIQNIIAEECKLIVF